MSVGYCLELAEERLHNLQFGHLPNNLEDTIELYHIKKLLDNGCKLDSWTEKDYNQFKTITSSFEPLILKQFKAINTLNILSEYNKLPWDYRQTFWEIIDNFHLYKLLDSNSITFIMSQDINSIRYILLRKNIVKQHGQIIRKILIDNKISAQLMLEEFVAKKDMPTDNKMFFPDCLTSEDKEQIINNYLNGEQPNLNYVRLIIQAKDCSLFKLTPKTRLNAIKLEKKLNDELLIDQSASTIQSDILFKLIEDETAQPFEVERFPDKSIIFKYSLPYIKKCDNVKRVLNCIYLLGWMNRNFLINLISKKGEISVIESIIPDKAKTSYPDYTIFRHVNNIASSSTAIYSEALKYTGSSLEEEFKTFYENHLREEYYYPGLNINIPSSNYPWQNKCLILFPELDAIAKQYNIYIEEGEIDLELISISKQFKVTEAQSFLEKKYYEIENGNKEIGNVLNLLFSSQAMLAYIEPFKNKYDKLINLLENETVLYSNYNSYQKPQIDFLVSLGIISIDDKGYITIADKPKINVLKSLWEYGVCSYWHHNEKEQAILDEMLEKGWLKTDNHLFSKPERDYYSYYLDNSEFTNGYAYRNHYAHGDTPAAEGEKYHIAAYQVLLRLFAMLILKIYDDLWLAKRVFIMGAPKY